MHFELSQRFHFEAAHTLDRQAVDAKQAAGSRRVHGHTYHAEVALRGAPDTTTGMVLDLALLRAEIAVVRDALDHHLLDDVPGLARPTLENLCRFIADALLPRLPALHSVRVWREASGDASLLTL